MIETAIFYATKKHENQKRKYINIPYIVHPLTVMEIVRGCVQNHTEEMLCAAVLHDTVEDTDATIEEIHKIFGKTVAEYVHYLSDISKPEDGNRRTRKEIDRIHISKGPAEVHSIKLADLIDNSASILLYDPNFAKIYIKEKEALLEVLTKGDSSLIYAANEIVKNFYLQRIKKGWNGIK